MNVEKEPQQETQLSRPRSQRNLQLEFQQGLFQPPQQFLAKQLFQPLKQFQAQPLFQPPKQLQQPLQQSKQQSELQADFGQVLQGLGSPDNGVKFNAQAIYDGIPGSDKALLLLGNLASRDNPEQVRSFAAALLNGLLCTDFDKVFPQMSPENQNQLKSQLLCNIQMEAVNPEFRKQVALCASQLAQKLMGSAGAYGQDRWPELPEFVFACSGASNAALREAALEIFANIPGVLGGKQSPHQEKAREMLFRGLNDPVNSVKCAAVRAVSCLLLAHGEDAAILSVYGDSLPTMMKILWDTINYGTPEETDVIQCFVELSAGCPSFLRPRQDELLQMCSSAAQNPMLPDPQKEQIIQVIIMLTD